MVFCTGVVQYNQVSWSTFGGVPKWLKGTVC